MSNKKILEPISVAVSGIFAAQSIPILKGWISPSALIIIGSAVVSILTYHLLIFLFRTFPKKFKRTRGIIDSKSKYEGYYLEIKNIKRARLYAIICIKYDISSNEYLLSGTALEKDGTISVQWKSNFVMIDDLNKKIIYAQTGHLTHSTNGKIFDGVTYMNFDHFLGNQPNSGFGHFIDTIPSKSDFAFQRINREDCEKYLKKNQIKSRQDYINFVIEFHKNNSNKLFSWES